MVALPSLNWRNCSASLAPPPKNAWIGLDRLIANGDIKGFTVRLRDDVGKDFIRAFIVIEVEGSPKATISAVKRLPGVKALSNTNGMWDMIAEIEVSTMLQLNELISTVRATSGVAKSETYIMLGQA